MSHDSSVMSPSGDLKSPFTIPSHNRVTCEVTSNINVTHKVTQGQTYVCNRRWVKDADGEGVRDVVEKITYPTTGAPVRERYMETHYMSHSQDGEGFTPDWVLQAVPDNWNL